jgi:hypothetical protein
MQNEAKRLLELASVDLGYAQLEVQFAEQPTEALSRIGYHLSELEKRLDTLICSIESVDATAHRSAELSMGNA